MRPPLLIALLALVGLGAFFLFRTTPTPALVDSNPPVETAPEQPAALLEKDEEEKTTVTAAPNANKNRLTGPHDGRHTRSGFACEACKYQPLLY